MKFCSMIVIMVAFVAFTEVNQVYAEPFIGYHALVQHTRTLIQSLEKLSNRGTQVYQQRGTMGEILPSTSFDQGLPNNNANLQTFVTFVDGILNGIISMRFVNEQCFNVRRAIAQYCKSVKEDGNIPSTLKNNDTPFRRKLGGIFYSSPEIGMCRGFSQYCGNAAPANPTLEYRKPDCLSVTSDWEQALQEW